MTILFPCDSVLKNLHMVIITKRLLTTPATKPTDSIGDKSDIPPLIDVVDSGIGTGKRFRYLSGGKYHQTAIWFNNEQAKETIDALHRLGFIAKDTFAAGMNLIT